VEPFGATVRSLSRAIRALVRRRWAAGPCGAVGPGGAAGSRSPVPVINYIRVPDGIALLHLLVWFPLILGLSAAAYHRASGSAPALTSGASWPSPG
jgi:hypothetical protein